MPDLTPFLSDLMIRLPLILLAFTVHEFAHAWVANQLGDSTARLLGRLTFNPMAHLDLLGTIAIVIGPVGWAKPVPVTTNALRHPRLDMAIIAAAGPLTNLAFAFFFAVLLQQLSLSTLPLHAPWWHSPLALLLQNGILLNVTLAIFNLLPLVPLDGSRVLTGLLPLHHAITYDRFAVYGPVILLLLIFSGTIQYVIWPPITLLTGFLLST